MEKQPGTSKSLGQVIDELIAALSSLDESTRVTAIKTVCEYLKIRPPEILEIKPPTSVAGTVLPGIAPVPPATDLKALREEKKPTYANEMAAIVAFYLSELAPQSDRKQVVELNDMIKYFKQGKFPLPQRPQFLLQNAKNAGYLDSVGEGRYRLNPVGYNLVAHNLPRSISASAKKQPARRKRAKSKSQKK